MSQHRGAIVKDKPQVLTPAANSGELMAGQGRLEERGILRSTTGTQSASINNIDTLDDSRNDVIFKPGSNGLDLGELRHRCESPASAR